MIVGVNAPAAELAQAASSTGLFSSWSFQGTQIRRRRNYELLEETTKARTRTVVAKIEDVKQTSNLLEEYMASGLASFPEMAYLEARFPVIAERGAIRRDTTLLERVLDQEKVRAQIAEYVRKGHNAKDPLTAYRSHNNIFETYYVTARKINSILQFDTKQLARNLCQINIYSIISYRARSDNGGKVIALAWCARKTQSDGTRNITKASLVPSRVLAKKRESSIA
ncbi:MAG: hypothetical protein A2666_00475 [Parcubacteria group bacterium RIFCSPHIGHO2_01_FULL_47_10b]|nr:MAG: hypothetical protein A2666_00475 [Parcubacteria group bacterium RIFCSPHIGHO2_01_FULL_47_10b]